MHRYESPRAQSTALSTARAAIVNFFKGRKGTNIEVRAVRVRYVNQKTCSVIVNVTNGNNPRNVTFVVKLLKLKKGK